MTDEVELREVLQADLAIFYAHQREPAANQMAAFPARDWAGFMAHWTRILGDGGSLKKTILWNGQVVGNIVSYGPTEEREVGYWIGREFWGKGIATRALAAFLDQEQTRPLFAHVAQQNLASLRVLQKCRFSLIGEDRWTPTQGGPVVEEYKLRLE